MLRTLHLAPVVYNGLGTPRGDGGVLVQEALGESTVVVVGDAGELENRYPDVRQIRHPFALSPAPVNAHTHLDLTAMPYARRPYEAFIREVVFHSRSGGRCLGAARAGVAELLAAGTRVIGDIVTREDVMRYLLGHEELAGVAYWEVLGPQPHDAERILAETEERLTAYRAWERPGGMRVGVSPHSPHTVSPELLKGLARLASRLRLPLQIHVAESGSELHLHRRGEGPLASMLEGFGVRWQPSGLSPVGYLESLGVLEAAPTLVHMVHVSEEDVRLVQRRACTVVHCPRSNIALGCGRFPWELYARHGVTVALGTDSRGSSPSLWVGDEVAAGREIHGEKAPAKALVWAAVKGGYRALHLTPPRIMRGGDAGVLLAWGPGGSAKMVAAD